MLTRNSLGRSWLVDEALKGEADVFGSALADERLRFPFSLEGVEEVVATSAFTGASWGRLPDDRLRGSKAPPMLAFLLFPFKSLASEAGVDEGLSAFALVAGGFAGGGTYRILFSEKTSTPPPTYAGRACTR